tara:strand:- start:243 stop:548 length:306 start_codon:yes stop_codon:yes gene_type:complete
MSASSFQPKQDPAPAAVENSVNDPKPPDDIIETEGTVVEKSVYACKDLNKKPKPDDRGIFSENLWSNQKVKYWNDIKAFNYLLEDKKDMEKKDILMRKRRK